MKAQEIAARFGGGKRPVGKFNGADVWPCKCPIHGGDSNNSLHLWDGDGDSLAAKCHGGCSYQAVLNAAGVEFTYEGRRHVYGNGGHVTRRRGPGKDLTGNYGSPRGLLVKLAEDDAPENAVVLVEGEKAFDALAFNAPPRYTAAHWVGGADSVEHADYSPNRGPRSDSLARRWPAWERRDGEGGGLSVRATKRSGSTVDGGHGGATRRRRRRRRGRQDDGGDAGTPGLVRPAAANRRSNRRSIPAGYGGIRKAFEGAPRHIQRAAPGDSREHAWRRDRGAPARPRHPRGRGAVRGSGAQSRPVEPKPDEPVFPNSNGNRPVLPDVLLPLIRDAAGDPDATVHGLRGSFRTWAADLSGFESEIAEHALAHLEGSATLRAYQRSTYFEKRRELMEAWARYVTESPRPA